MYILIKDDVDLGHAILASAHASLSCYLTFKGDPTLEDWALNSFRKVVCKVNAKEFEKAKSYPDFRIMTEMALANDEIALVFKPRDDWPEFFKWLKLYR